KSIYIRPICNNNPSSAPLMNGRTFFVCWRCTGGVLGGFISILFCFILDITLDFRYLLTIFLIVPGTIDYFLGRLYILKPNNWRRFATGILLGVPVGIISLLILQQIP